MTALELRNAILLLGCMDADEFGDALFEQNEVWNDPRAVALWNTYQKDPVKFYIHASDAHRNALWAIIETRLTKGSKNDTPA